jgi:hypothetical protein
MIKFVKAMISLRHFEELRGTWTKVEKAKFDVRIADLERVDALDWR